MARFLLGLIMAVVVLCWSAGSAEAQVYYRYPNRAGVHVLPYPYPYTQYYWVPSNQYGAIQHAHWPVYGGVNPWAVQRTQWTVQRTQLDPMRHFFSGNGSSYSHGTSQMWGRTGF